MLVLCSLWIKCILNIEDIIAKNTANVIIFHFYDERSSFFLKKIKNKIWSNLKKLLWWEKKRRKKLNERKSTSTTGSVSTGSLMSDPDDRSSQQFAGSCSILVNCHAGYEWNMRGSEGHSLWPKTWSNCCLLNPHGLTLTRPPPPPQGREALVALHAHADLILCV